MQILVVFFLAAIVCCYGDQSECLERADPCVNDFLTSLVDGSSGYKRCRRLINSIQCLDNAVESCDGEGELVTALKMAVEEMKEIRIEKCSSYNVLSEDDEIQNCFEANEDYVKRCIIESLVEILDELDDQRDAENYEDLKNCGMYMRIGECAVQRLEEKCGAKAVEEAEAQLKNIPDDVKEACKASGVVLHAGTLDDDRKKK